MYLSKLPNVFVQLSKCICPNCQNLFVQIAKFICQNRQMYLSQLQMSSAAWLGSPSASPLSSICSSTISQFFDGILYLMNFLMCTLSEMYTHPLDVSSHLLGNKSQFPIPSCHSIQLANIRIPSLFLAWPPFL